MIFKRRGKDNQETESEAKTKTPIKKQGLKNLLDPGSLIFLILALGIDLATIVLYGVMFFMAQIFNIAIAAAIIGPFIYAIKFIGILFIGLWFFTKSDASGKAKVAKASRLWKFIGVGIGTSTPGIGAFFFLTLLVFSEIVKQ